MKIQSFKATVKDLQYKEVESKSKFHPGKNYLVNTTLIESKRGNGKFKTYHNAVLYLTEEEFDQEILNVGDIIELSNECDWASTLIRFNTYSEEKLKGIDKSKLKKDEKGRTYAPLSAYAYRVTAKIGRWKILTKYDELYYFSIGLNNHTKVKCPCRNEADFNEQMYAFYESDAKTIENLKLVTNFTSIPMICYAKNQKVAEFKVKVELSLEEKINKYYVKIEKVQ